MYCRWKHRDQLQFHKASAQGWGEGSSRHGPGGEEESQVVALLTHIIVVVSVTVAVITAIVIVCHRSPFSALKK